MKNDKAWELYNKGKYDEAIEKCNDVLRKDRENYRAKNTKTNAINRKKEKEKKNSDNVPGKEPGPLAHVQSAVSTLMAEKPSKEPDLVAPKKQGREINMNKKECISEKFSEGLDIFDDHFGYPVIDKQEIYDGPTAKVVDIQGHRHMRGEIFSTRNREISALRVIKIAFGR